MPPAGQRLASITRRLRFTLRTAADTQRCLFSAACAGRGWSARWPGEERLVNLEVNAARGGSLLRETGSRLLAWSTDATGRPASSTAVIDRGRARVLCTVCSLRMAHPQMFHPLMAHPQMTHPRMAHPVSTDIIECLLGVLLVVSRVQANVWSGAQFVWKAVGDEESADDLVLPLPPVPRVCSPWSPPPCSPTTTACATRCPAGTPSTSGTPRTTMLTPTAASTLCTSSAAWAWVPPTAASIKLRALAIGVA